MTAETNLTTYLSSKGITHYRAAGHEVTAHCWWCLDGDPKGRGKLYLNTESWLYSCKRCDASGNRKTLLEYFGDADEVEHAATDPMLRRRILTEAAQLAHEMLLANKAKYQYLLDRGLTDEIIREAKLGYVPRSIGLSEMIPMRSELKGYVALIESGLVTPDGRETFNDCITIPYFSHGTVVQIRAKFIDGKYKTAGGDVTRLYGSDELFGADRVLITEGEFDRLAVKVALAKAPSSERAFTEGLAVVGLPGAGSWPEGLVQMLEGASKVFIGLDPDETGKKFAAKLADELGPRSRIVELPESEPKTDWSDYLMPITGTKPHSGHSWQDVRNLMVEADLAGKQMFSILDIATKWERAQTERPGLKLGWPSLDSVIRPGIKPGQVMVPLAATGTGKALADDEPVLTERGWVPIGEVKVGDRTYGSDGLLHDVLGVFPQGERDLFDVAFSDGVTIRCDEDHLWNYRIGGGVKPWRTGTLRDFRGADRVYVPVAAPIQADHAILPLDPYALGVLLGDGCFRHTSVTLTTDDEIVASLDLPVPAQRLADNGPGVGEYRLSEHGQQGRRSPLNEALRDLGLWRLLSHEKFIPHTYLQASVEQRWALLQGLLDTDGSIDKRGCIEFSTSSPRLAADFHELVASLGGISRVCQRGTSHRDNYRMHPRFASTECPFRLTRKAARWSPSRHAPQRRVVSVTAAGRGPATCISVSAPDRLFLARGHVPTHNTVFLSNLAHNLREKHVLYISLEMTTVEVYEHLRRIHRFHYPAHTRDELLLDLSRLAVTERNRLGKGDLGDLLHQYQDEFGQNVDLVIVDYLQYYARGFRGTSMYDRVSDAIMEVKAVAKEEAVPVVIPSQVNRGAEPGKPLLLQDARDAGTIEETADFIPSLYRPDLIQDREGTEPLMQTGSFSVKWLKSRHGGVGKVNNLRLSNLSLAIVDSTFDRKNNIRVEQENALHRQGLHYDDYLAQLQAQHGQGALV